MDLLLIHKLPILPFCLLVLQTEAETEIGDYIVDCSACNSVAVQGVSSYSCKVRCEASGKIVQPVILLLKFGTKVGGGAIHKCANDQFDIV